ncbi:MAG: glycosyltransferase family 2 protein [bacterium]|nr:glycosyltransferase family 2 protein [bacterium]
MPEDCPSAEPRFSLIVPIHDEEDNIDELFDEVATVLGPHGPFEVLAVDDGSRDGSLAALRDWKARQASDWLRIVRLRANVGQSAAVMAGIELARAPVVATIDGDMQNDPADIPAMLERIESGEADGVFGVRAQRQDTWVRRWSSRIGNAVRNLITGDSIRDAACGIKVVRRDLFVRAPHFVGMHRFMATLVRYLGGRVVEVDVNHRQRNAGRAKYGIGNRMLRGLRDCFAVRWLRSRVLMHRVEEEF